jgi:LPXTG-site transpeptidase (sortase) family protein
VTLSQHGRRRRRVLAAALVLLGLAGLALIAAAAAVVSAQSSPMRSAPRGTTMRASGVLPTAAEEAVAQPRYDQRGSRIVHHPGERPINWQMPDPVRLIVPAMGLSAPIVPLGLNPDGTLQVPTSFSVAGWFTNGPEPGERGAAVIAGHIDSVAGPGVFYHLRALRRGDVVTVVVRGGSLVRFKVTGTLAVPKTHFPRSLVYRHTTRPTLRLITCDGAFDTSTGHYVDNYIVFATLMTGSRSRSVRLLPDLRQEGPWDLTVTKAHGRFRLGFGSAATNVGMGPLLIHGERAAGDQTMHAVQRVKLSSGATQVLSGVGRLHYVVSPDHQHWHLEPFMTYELRRFGDRKLVGRDVKSGFCLGDRYTFGHLPGAPRRPVFRTNCGRGLTQLRQVSEGISVGYGDDYAANLEGQYIDITGVPAGRYYLVHRVNSSHRLAEVTYDNNVAWVSLRLSWKHGRPHVRILDRCTPTTEPNSCAQLGR